MKEVKDVAAREEILAAQETTRCGERLTARQAEILANDAKVAGGNASLQALQKAATADKVSWPFGKK